MFEKQLTVLEAPTAAYQAKLLVSIAGLTLVLLYSKCRLISWVFWPSGSLKYSVIHDGEVSTVTIPPPYCLRATTAQLEWYTR